MSRTVTVTFDDGSSHVYNGVPDDITPDQIIERAGKEFSGKEIASLDGGKKAAAAAPTEKPAPTQSADGRTLTPAAARMEQLLTKATGKDSGIGSLAKGAGESTLSAVSGLASTAAGGVLGGARALYSLASGEGVDKALDKGSETIHKVQEMGTYQPRGDTGKLLNEVMGATGEAPGKVVGAAGGAVGEALGGTQGRIRGEAIGEVLPAVVPLAMSAKATLKNMGRPKAEDSRGASKLREAMKDMTPEELDQARALIQRSNEAGVPLTGPEAFEIAPKLHQLMTEVDKSNDIVSRFVKQRPEQAKVAIKKELDEIGDDVGLHEAANKAQEAADTVISDAQKFRTEAASPDYQAQRASDAETLKLIQEVKSTQKNIKDGTAWKNDAIQQAGRWYQFSHEMGLKANEVAATVLDWSKRPDAQKKFKEGDALTVEDWKSEVLKKHPMAKFTKEDGSGKTYGEEGDWTAHTGPDMQADVVGVHAANNGFASVWDRRRKQDVEYSTKDADDVGTFEGEGGRIDTSGQKREDIQNYLNRAGEGASATRDAVKIARERQNYIDQWQKEVEVKADKLAEKNLPYIQERLQAFMSDLNTRINLVNPDTTEGQILTQFKNDLAPNGQPLMLPSQLESVYKASRDKLDLNLNPSPLEKTTAGVLAKNVKSLDALIQEVSPAIKQGREIYAQLSKEFVDPLMKSPIGRIAGKGADAQKEAIISRVTAELQGDGATPDRIRMVAEELNKVDAEAFPNMVRAHLESKFDKAATVKLGQTGRLTGARFAEAIASSPKMRQNLAVMIEKTAEAQGKSKVEARQAARGFNGLMEVLHATGRVAKIGVQGLDEAAVGVEKAAPALAHSKTYGAAKTVATTIKDFVNRGAYKNLGRVFTDPNSIDKMISLANTKAAAKAERQRLVIQLLEESVAPATVGAALAPGEEE